MNDYQTTLALRRPITEIDVPEYGWLSTGVFLTPEQQAIVNAAKRHETVTHLDGNTLSRVTVSYKFHVRQFGEAAGFMGDLLIFEVTDTGELLVARWHLPGEYNPVLDMAPNGE